MKCSGWSPRPGSDLPHPGGPLCRPVCAPDTSILEISTSELDFQTFSFVLKVWFGWKSVIYVMNTPRFFFLTSWDLLQANSGLSRRGIECRFHRTCSRLEIEGFLLTLFTLVWVPQYIQSPSESPQLSVQRPMLAQESWRCVEIMIDSIPNEHR